MSHEIRTPLNGVLGVAGVLAGTALDTRQREMVSIIESSTRGLERLLSDVLDIARVESGRLTITNEPFALAELVRETSALFASAAREKGLAYTCELAGETEVMAVADALRLKQILINLISNAVKFTGAGKVAVRCRRDADTGETAFEVQDTGVGFAPEKAATLFGRFEQADNSITRRFGGAGLGLAISRDLAKLMGGTIEAVSAVGEGALFRLVLPMPRHDAAAPEPVAANEAATAPAERLRVLVADDHAVNRRVVEMILDTIGAELTSVEDGAQAVEAFKVQAFDIVLMDMQMPVMDGLSAIRAIRRLEARRGAPRTPILALTANALPEHIRATRKAGADAHIAKPVTAATLIAGVLAAAEAGEPQATAAA